MKNKNIIYYLVTSLLLVVLCTPVVFARSNKSLQVFEGESVSRLKSLARFAAPLDSTVSFERRVDDLVIARFKGHDVRSREVVVKYRNSEKPELVKIKGDMSAALEKLKAQKNVEYAEPDYIVSASFTPNDTHFALQWNLLDAGSGGINMETAWTSGVGTDVPIAILDTGVAYRTKGEYLMAPDLANTCFVPGVDLVNKTDTPYDNNGHGTHVAGTIAQSTHNALGVSGIAFKSCIMPVKVLNKMGLGTYSRVAEGIRWAADHGAKVINMSFGGPVPAQVIEDALKYAFDKGVTLVAAAGNDNSPQISYPAAYDDYVIAVGATTFDASRASYSNHGPSLDIMAPGGDLTEDKNGDGFGDGILQNTFNLITNDYKDFAYWFLDGTSHSAPHVSAVVAIMYRKNKVHNGAEALEAITESAKDLGVPGRDDEFGYGLLDASATMQWTK